MTMVMVMVVMMQKLVRSRRADQAVVAWERANKALENLNSQALLEHVDFNRFFTKVYKIPVKIQIRYHKSFVRP